LPVRADDDPVRTGPVDHLLDQFRRDHRCGDCGGGVISYRALAQTASSRNEPDYRRNSAKHMCIGDPSRNPCSVLNKMIGVLGCSLGYKTVS
jgi:hypothetical protein